VVISIQAWLLLKEGEQERRGRRRVFAHLESSVINKLLVIYQNNVI